MTKYPSLYAALEVATRDGQRGATVRCSATFAELGFVFWTSTGGTRVAWHWRAPDGHVGETTTERNAVQALRDYHKRSLAPHAERVIAETRARLQTKTKTTKTPAPALPFTDDAPARPAPAAARPTPQRINWTTTNTTTTHDVGDLRDAIARAFDRAKEKK